MSNNPHLDADIEGITLEIGKLYEEHVDSLRRFLRSRIGDGPPDPEDISQLAFQKLLERGSSADISDIGAYLRRAAWNLALNERAKSATRTRNEPELRLRLHTDISSYESPVESVLYSRQQLDIINDALMQQSAVRRRAFVLNRIDGLSITDVGRELGISRPAASKHVAKAMNAVATALALADCHASDAL